MEEYLNKESFNKLGSRYRANLINSISGYKSANLIGTVNSDGVGNLSIVSSVVHIGSDPSLMGFVLRPTTVPRHTYENILFNNSFTINQVHKGIVGKSHYTSAKFTSDESEFSELQLSEHYIEGFEAPYVKDSKVKIGLTFKEEHLLSNGCRLIIGEVDHLMIEQSALKDDGSVDLGLIDTVAVSGLNQYYLGNFLKEFKYAKKEDIKTYLSKPAKERPDNIVYNTETKTYDAALKKYSTNVGAPFIEYQDLGNWKRVGATKINHHLKTKYEAIKDQYDSVLKLYEWNQIIYSSKFNFEPITGMIYHLYKDASKNFFLSKIGPTEWKKDFQGSFKLNFDRMFEQVNINNDLISHLK